MRILLLEDDLSMAERIDEALVGAFDAHVTTIVRGEKALELASRPGFDVLVLDRMVIGLDGLSVLAELRSREVQTPALILSSKNAAKQKVEGLDTGADDYLGKPFEDFELVARVRALCRRADKMEHPDVRAHGPLLLILRSRRALWRPGVPEGAERYAKRFVADQRFDLQLTDKEFDILHCLAEAYPDAASKDDIWRFAWQSYQLADWRQVVNVNMSRLRRKLDDRTGRRLVENLGQALVSESFLEKAPDLAELVELVRAGSIQRGLTPTQHKKGHYSLELRIGKQNGRLELDSEPPSRAGPESVNPFIKTVESEGYALATPDLLEQLATIGSVFR